jgi:hypothetical protein
VRIARRAGALQADQDRLRKVPGNLLSNTWTVTDTGIETRPPSGLGCSAAFAAPPPRWSTVSPAPGWAWS